MPDPAATRNAGLVRVASAPTPTRAGYGPPVLRWLRDVLIIGVFAGALTAFVLHAAAVGAVLAVVGGVMLNLAARGHKSMTFGGLVR